MTTVPDKVKPVFDEFRDEFTEQSFESFTQLTSALINSEKRRTVRRLYGSISGGKSRTAYGYFFNDAKWNEVRSPSARRIAFLRNWCRGG